MAKTESLIQQFVENVVGQDEAMMAGNSRRSNRCEDRTIAAYRKLRDMGEGGIDTLGLLLEHERPLVRSNVATFLLPRKTERALAVLRECAKMDNFEGFLAGEGIKRWEEGAWNLDA